MKKIVVKIGSSILAPKGEIDQGILDNFIQDIVYIDNLGIKMVIVSSGAIACGLKELGYKRKPSDISLLMAASSLGQTILMNLYRRRFVSYKKKSAQILLTWDDFNERKRYINARATINKLLTFNIFPVINENDAVATDEIKFGDNDRLSAMVANLIDADLLIILSDVEGLLDKGTVVPIVEKIDNRIMSLANKEDKIFTTGGMKSKLEAAKIAMASGIKTVVAKGNRKNVLRDIVEGKSVGTIFLPQQVIKGARKKWIIFGKKIKGRIYVDEGAEKAIMQGNKSLLCVGITKVEGDFLPQDAVEVLNNEGIILGCGIVNYSSREIHNKLGEKMGKEVIHRDNFVKIGGIL